MTTNTNNLEQNVGSIHERRNDIDALRIFATIFLIYFHTALLFVLFGGYVIQNDELSLEMWIVVIFVSIWYMPLFFFIAGMSTFYSLNFRTEIQYAKERFKRLFIPLIFGILIVIPPMSYFARIAWWCKTRWRTINYNGSYFEYYPHFFERETFTWAHLWFLFYLFFISLVFLIIILRFKKETLKKKISSIANFYAKGKKIFLFALPLILINIGLRWLYPGYITYLIDWVQMLFFLIIYIFGFLIVGDNRFEVSIDRNKKLALVLAILTSFIFIEVILFIIYRINNFSRIYLLIIYLMYWAFFSMSTWYWLIAIFGYGRKYLNKQNALINHLSEISLPFYILHHTVIIIIGYYVLQWEASILIKFLIISISSLFITILLCELVKTNNITRFIFGMRLKEKKNHL